MNQHDGFTRDPWRCVCLGPFSKALWHDSNPITGLCIRALWVCAMILDHFTREGGLSSALNGPAHRKILNDKSKIAICMQDSMTSFQRTFLAVVNAISWSLTSCELNMTTVTSIRKWQGWDRALISWNHSTEYGVHHNPLTHGTTSSYAFQIRKGSNHHISSPRRVWLG